MSYPEEGIDDAVPDVRKTVVFVPEDDGDLRVRKTWFVMWAESARGWERKDPPMLGLIDYLAVVSIQVLANGEQN